VLRFCVKEGQPYIWLARSGRRGPIHVTRHGAMLSEVGGEQWSLDERALIQWSAGSASKRYWGHIGT